MALAPEPHPSSPLGGKIACSVLQLQQLFCMNILDKPKPYPPRHPLVWGLLGDFTAAAALPLGDWRFGAGRQAQAGGTTLSLRHGMTRSRFKML